MDWDRDEQRQKVLREKEGLHREHHVEEQRAVSDSPSHRRTRGADEQGINGEAQIGFVHWASLHAEHAADPRNNLWGTEPDRNSQDRGHAPPPRKPLENHLRKNHL